MKLDHLKYFLLLSSIMILTHCASYNRALSTTRTLTNTTWIYADNDRKYKITFLNNGRIESTHPNESTPDNDFWRQNGQRIRISVNDGYAIYKGTILNDSEIKGTAKNKAGKRWRWVMKKI